MDVTLPVWIIILCYHGLYQGLCGKFKGNCNTVLPWSVPGALWEVYRMDVTLPV